MRKFRWLTLGATLLTVATVLGACGGDKDPVKVGSIMDFTTVQKVFKNIRPETWKKLNDPLIAVEAAAREIDWIIDRVNENLQHTWPSSLLTGPIDRRNPFGSFISRNPFETDPYERQVDAERAMTLLVCAAYNTDTIIWSDFLGRS